MGRCHGLSRRYSLLGILPIDKNISLVHSSQSLID